ncbi:hypothetical protein CEV31_3215 [Brucella thiophenivorans]|uniref:Uncharacterized protein n=1 Tax=Brucella thiophenivorans TaxID=571255 RepID=A0A256FIR7_9HYPH|nr:hypothetical protein CEV31_3215 [Brucella thiophenivorans]
MIFFSHPYDRFYDIWEAATAATTLGYCIKDSSRDDETPAIFIEKLRHNSFNIFIGNNVAAAD